MTARRWLFVVVLAGAALRFVPVWFGLPYLQARPDEDAATGIATQVLGGALNPRFFHWPSLIFYLFAGVYWLVGLVRDAPIGTVEFILIARIVVACAGTATIVVLFWMTRRAAGETIALIAAALLAVAVLHVRDSHFALTDVVMTLLVTVSLALLLRALDETDERRALRWFAAAGFAGGLATSTKYNAAAVAAAMGAAQIVLFARGWRVAALRPSIVYALLFIAAFVVGTPYSVLDFPKFKEDVLFDITHLAGGHGIDLGRGWIYHPTRTLPYGLGPTAFVAAILGVVPLIRRHGRMAFVMGAFVLALYASIGSGRTVFFRYILPLIPIACVAAAAGVQACAEWLSGQDGLARVARLKRPIAERRAVYVVLLTLTIGPGLVNSVWFDALLARTDSRVVAGRWLEERLQPEDTLHDAGGDYTSLDLSQIRFQSWDFDPETSSFSGPDGRAPDWLILYQSPLYTYTRTAWQLQSLSQTQYRPVYTVRATTGGRRRAVYDLQDAFFMPFWGFWTVHRPGPTIHIYRRNDLP